MKKSLLSVFILLVISLLSLRISSAQEITQEDEDWNKLVHVPEWNDAQKIECVQKLISETLKSSEEFKDLTVKLESVKYHWQLLSDLYSFKAEGKDTLSGWIFVRFEQRIAYNILTGEERVIERRCVLDQENINNWDNAFELKDKTEKVIYSIPGTGKSHINIDMQG